MYLPTWQPPVQRTQGSSSERALFKLRGNGLRKYHIEVTPPGRFNIKIPDFLLSESIISCLQARLHVLILARQPMTDEGTFQIPAITAVVRLPVHSGRSTITRCPMGGTLRGQR